MHDVGAAARRTAIVFGLGRAARSARRAAGSTGCAIETCATQPWPKKRLLAREGAVDELVDQHEQRPAYSSSLNEPTGRDRDDVGDAGALQRVDIGAVVDVGRRKAMAAPVARQEDAPASPPSGRRAGRPTARPRATRRGALRGALEARQIVDARAADDSENRLRHASLARADVHHSVERTGERASWAMPLCLPTQARAA